MVGGSFLPKIVVTTTWKRILLVASSLFLAYLIAFVTLIIRRMNFWMRGSYAISYQAIFLFLLFILLLWWVCRHHNGRLPILSTIAFSIPAGYGAGVVALAVYPLFQSDGLQHMTRSLTFSTPEAAIAFLWFPIRLLTWLFGAV